MTTPSAPADPQQSLNALYREHHGWLYGWLRKKTACSAQAADLAQDTFVRVLTRRDSPLVMREPRAWLTTIARGLLVDHWRRQELERAWMEAMAARPQLAEPSVEQRLLLLEALVHLDAMLARLPQKVRQTFVMSQIQGMKYSEIAARFGVTDRTIKNYMAQAMLQCIALDDVLQIRETLADGARPFD